MKGSLEKNELLKEEKLFGIKRTNTKTAIPNTTAVDVSITQHNNPEIEKALLKAEHKKAQALTIIRHYTFQ